MSGKKVSELGAKMAASLAAELKALDTPPEVPGGTAMGQVGLARHSRVSAWLPGAHRLSSVGAS
jgi:hypothetical protein